MLCTLMELHSTIFKIVFSRLYGEKILVKWVRLLPLGIKSVNPIQKYLHNTESYACIQKIFVTIVDLSIKF